MDQTAEVAEHTLGLDLGSASVGWALIALDSSHNPHTLLRAGVRIFEPGVEGSMSKIERGEDQSKAIVRRNARLHRLLRADHGQAGSNRITSCLTNRELSHAQTKWSIQYKTWCGPGSNDEVHRRPL